jgi:hypothetical protein
MRLKHSTSGHGSRGLGTGSERRLYLDNRKSAALSGTSGSCQNRKSPDLFDHLVGNGSSDGQAGCLRGLEIDHELELGGLND